MISAPGFHGEYAPGNVNPDCFYCGNIIHEHADYKIAWSGSGAVIEMHGECARDLCVRLIRDVHEFECKGKGFRIEP